MLPARASLPQSLLIKGECVFGSITSTGQEVTLHFFCSLDASVLLSHKAVIPSIPPLRAFIYATTTSHCDLLSS